MSRPAMAVRVAAALALLAASPGALAYNRTKTASGVPLRWENSRLTYFVNSTDFMSTQGCSNAGAAIRAAFPSWSGAKRVGEARPCTGFGFVDGGDTNQTELGFDTTPGASNTNLVVFRKGLCSDIDDSICHSQSTMGECVARWNCWSHGDGAGVLALTTTTFIPETGALVDADLELFGWDGVMSDDATGIYFTCADLDAPACQNYPAYGEAGCTAVDIQAIVTHEAGHMLGLAHPDEDVTDDTNPDDDEEATMYSIVIPGETTHKRSLEADDIEGVCAIYPPTSSSSTNWSTSPGLSCGSGGGGAAGLIGLAFLLWRRRRADGRARSI